MIDTSSFAAIAGALLAALGSPVVAEACAIGEPACPQVLQFAPGATSVAVSGKLTQQRASHMFSFAARKGQTVLVHEEGAVVRGQLLLQSPTGADSSEDDLYLDAPYKLTATGIYRFSFTANTQAEEAFGPFRATVTIK